MNLHIPQKHEYFKSIKSQIHGLVSISISAVVSV